MKYWKRILSLLLALVLLAALVPAALADDSVSGSYTDSAGNTIAWTLRSGTLTIGPSGSTSGAVTADGRQIKAYITDSDVAAVVIGSGITEIAIYAFDDGFENLQSLTLPDSIQKIGDWAFKNKPLLSLIIPDNCTLGSAFENCTALTSATLGENCSIGNYAFSGCSSLLSAVIGSGCSIGKYAFEDCTALTSVTLGKNCSIGSAAFSGSGLTGIILPDGCSLSSSAFYRCRKLQSVKFAGTCGETIPSQCFYGCEALQSISLPQGVTKIGNSAFAGCLSLSSLSLPEGLQTIGGSAFDSCQKLTSVVIPSTVTEIGEYAFRGCTSLSDLRFAGSLPSLGTSCLSDTPWYSSHTKTENGLTLSTDGSILYEADASSISGACTVPASVTVIATGVFKNCTGLTELRFAGSLSTLPDYFCAGCTALISVTWPQGLTELGEYAFSDCTALTSVSLPSGLTTLNVGIFSGCTKLASVRIPDTVTVIEYGVFDETGLTSLVIPDSVVCLDGAFQDCPNLTSSSVTLSKNLTSLGYESFNGCDSSLAPNYITTSSMTNNNFYLYTNLGTWFALAGSNTLWGSAGSTRTLPSVYGICSQAFSTSEHVAFNLTMPSSLRIISTEAFASQAYLTKLKLNEGLQSIGMYAIAFCPELTSLTIPSTVAKIGDGAFAYSGLTSITFTGNAPEIFNDGSLGTGAVFELFDGLTATVYYPAGADGWSDFIREDHGGTITWVPVGAAVTAGDVNGDGSVTLKDVSLLFRYVSGQIPESSIQVSAAEMDGKSGLTLTDVACLYQKIA